MTREAARKPTENSHLDPAQHQAAPKPKRLGESSGKPQVPGSGPLPKLPREITFVGSDFIDHGSACDRDPDGNDCFLDGDQRGRIREELSERNTHAKMTCKDAIAQLRTENLFENETDVPVWIGLVLDLATAHMAGKLIRAAGELKTSGATLYPRAKAAFSKINDDTIRTVANSAKDTTKRYALNKARKTPGFSERKGAIDAFLLALSDSTAQVFDTMHARAKASSDAALVTQWHALHQDHHTQTHYEQLIAEKVQRFKTSGVLDIGRRDQMPSHRLNKDGEQQPSVQYLTRAVSVGWVKFLSGYPTRLAFLHHDLTPDLELGRSNHPNDVVFVEDEFVEAAIQRHIQIYNVPPNTKFIDDRNWYWDPPRAAAAQRNWEAQQKGQSK